MSRILPFLAALALAACGTSTPSLETVRSEPDTIDPVPPVSAPDNPEDIVSSTGTITYVALEGGFYGLVGREGTRYLPLNLEERFKEDGLTVRFRGRLQDSVMTIQQWGVPLQIMEMLPATFDGDNGEQ